MTHQDKIYLARKAIWSNFPDLPHELDQCPKKCSPESLAPRGYPCISCTTKALAALVGQELANDYADTVKHLRYVERAMAMSGADYALS